MKSVFLAFALLILLPLTLWFHTNRGTDSTPPSTSEHAPDRHADESKSEHCPESGQAPADQKK